MNLNNLFSHEENKKKKDFDSYSKNSLDLISFYYRKYDFVDTLYKRPEYIQKNDFEIILSSLSGAQEYSFDHFDKPFELYILGFICFMEKKYDAAKKCFERAITLFNDEEISTMANIVLISLNLASIYQAEKQYKTSCNVLIKTLKLFKENPLLEKHINNLYASCYVRLGMVYLTNLENRKIATNLLIRSIFLRLKYKDEYPPFVCENYLAQAYRYYSISLNTISGSYAYFKMALSIRKNLVNTVRDEYNKVEYFYLLFDLSSFLIRNKFSIKKINKYSNENFKIIASLNSMSKQQNVASIASYSLMMVQCYLLSSDLKNFLKWYSVIKYFEFTFKFNLSEEHMKYNNLYNQLME